LLGALGALALLAFTQCPAAALSVSIVDARGEPVPDAIVAATPDQPSPSVPPAAPAVMDQIDARGSWQLPDAPAGEYRLTVWSPRLPRTAKPLERSVTLSDATPAVVAWRLTQNLQPLPGINRDPRLRDY
jgi:hypothetical protein